MPIRPNTKRIKSMPLMEIGKKNVFWFQWFIWPYYSGYFAYAHIICQAGFENGCKPPTTGTDNTVSQKFSISECKLNCNLHHAFKEDLVCWILLMLKNCFSESSFGCSEKCVFLRLFLKSEQHMPWEGLYFGSSWFICCFWYSGPSVTPEWFFCLWSWGHCIVFAWIVPWKQGTVCCYRWITIWTNGPSVWCPAGLCPWSSIVYSVHWYTCFSYGSSWS